MNKNRVLMVLSLAAFVVMADNWVVSPILPAISRDIGVNVANAALIISAYMLPFGLFQLVFGYLGDRYGRIRVITGAMVFFTIGTGLCAIATGLTDLTIYRALTGIFAGSVMPVSFALIGDLFPLNERQTAIGTFFGVAFLGQGLSTIIGGSIAYFFNWRGVFAVYAVLAVLSTVLLFTISKNIPITKHNDSKFFSPLMELLKNPSSRSMYLVVFFEGIFIMGSFSFLGEFIKNQYDFNNLLIGLIMSAFGIMAVMGGRIAGKISAKIGRKKTIILGFAGTMLANTAYVLWGNVLPILVLAIGLSGFGLMLAHSSSLTIATEFAAKARGIAMSLVAFCFMCGGSLGTAIGGKIMENGGFTNLFVIYGMGLLVLLAVIFISKKGFTIENVQRQSL
ncbi:MAG: Permease, related, tetracycline resistance protein [Firmicutes bacterium]|nr:Permease, related, tetracycline resistance protein [Bacillota bacterium]